MGIPFGSLARSLIRSFARSENTQPRYVLSDDILRNGAFPVEASPLASPRVQFRWLSN